MRYKTLIDKGFNNFDSQNRIRVKHYNSVNSFDSIATTISTVPTLINTPENADLIKLIHRADVTIYLGKDNTLTTSNGFPLIKNEYLELDIKKGNSNNIYAVVAADTQVIYSIAMVKE